MPQLSEEQQRALTLMKGAGNIFLTGKAGTGKSTVLQEFRDTNPENCVFVAPTGVAALNIKGSTIHSFFHLPAVDVLTEHTLRKHDEDRGHGGSWRRQIQQAKTIVVDEISMVRSDMLWAIDYRLRSFAIGDDRRRPFGGRKMIFVGDFFQLPPVVRNDQKNPEAQQAIQERMEELGGVYAFQTQEWRRGNFNCVRLEEVHRQTQPEFLEILNGIRVKDLDNATVNVENQMLTPLDALNRLCSNPEGGQAGNAQQTIVLSPKNRLVETINEREYNRLGDVEEAEFEALVWGEFAERANNLLPGDERGPRTLEKDPAQRLLKVKVGMRVMVLCNKKRAADGGWVYVNGDLGTVTGWRNGEIPKTLCPELAAGDCQAGDENRNEENSPYVEVRLDKNGEIVRVLPNNQWEEYKYIVQRKPEGDGNIIQQKIVGRFVQIPLTAAYAMTIHKSQGKTFDRVKLYQEQGGCFAHGQLYTALSRCKSLNGLSLDRPVAPEEVIVDPTVIEFWNNMGNGEGLGQLGQPAEMDLNAPPVEADPTADNWQIREPEDQAVDGLMKESSVTRPTALLLAARGVTPETVRNFLNPEMGDLGDPYLLPGTKDAAKRLWSAIQNNQRIMIHGDYDTDGITATALLAWVLRKNGAQVSCYLPHRIDDGYGLTADSINMNARERCDLLVTVACGSNISYDVVEAARASNLDLIITDNEELPENTDPSDWNVVVVDPKLQGTPEDIKELAGVGVAYKVACAFLKYGIENQIVGEETDLNEVLDLVALGTIAAKVSLKKENHILVNKGLEVLSNQRRLGVCLLGEAIGGIDYANPSDFAKKIKKILSYLDAPGCTKNGPAASLSLLEVNEANKAEGYELVQILMEWKVFRERTEEQVLAEARDKIIREHQGNLVNVRSLIVCGDNWDCVVLDAVANRLSKEYKLPCVVLNRNHGRRQYIGSAKWFYHPWNLKQALDECSDTLSGFATHNEEIILSLREEDLERFREEFDEAVQWMGGDGPMSPTHIICGTVSLNELDDIFFCELRMLERLGYGFGSWKPKFVSRNVCPERMVPIGGNSHTRGGVRDETGTLSIQFIAFNRRTDEFPMGPLDIVYTPQNNRFNGREDPQLSLHDIRPAAALMQ